MKDLEPVFLGFCVKKPWVPSGEWFQPVDTHVVAVCSVSECLAKRPPHWIDRWDFNRACCYDGEAAALATIPPGDENHFACFAYRLLPVTCDAEGRRVPVDPDTLFDPRLPCLPSLPARDATPARYARLGYDVVSVGTTMGFECSPLSCNGMANELPVNPYCLVDELARAFAIARQFNAEQPEPGYYVVVEVATRLADIERLAQPT